MKLTDFFFQNGNMKELSMPRTETAQTAGMVNRQIQALTPGATVRGQIVSRNGSEIQILLSEDLVLDAKVDSGIHLDLGKTITFEVRNNGNMLQLSPLFANTATDVNVLKALDMAGLPINEGTLQMTEHMMRAGLPVDKNSLQQVFREINQFPNASSEQVIGLHQLNIPVNDGSLKQMEAYSNLSHQITAGAEEIVHGMEEAIQNLMQDGNVNEAAKLYVALVDYVLDASDVIAENIESTENVAKPESAASAINLKSAESAIDLESAANAIKLKSAESAIDLESAASVINLKGAGSTIDLERTESIKNLEGAADIVNLEGSDSIIKREREGSIVLTEKVENTVNNGNAENKQLTDLKLLLTRGMQTTDREQLQSLLSDKQAFRLLQRQMNNTFLLRPEEVAVEGKVQELYRKINKQLTQLSQLLETSGNQNTAAYKATVNMSQNIDFLQQMNQMYSYIQLPLKLQEGKANGDLYVYTNKRNLSKKDGEISALLHLDMQHLGPVDVYVAMQAQRVQTKFYVADDAMLDFLEGHMDILTKRLAGKGYQCAVEMQVRSDQECNSGIVPLLTKQKQIPIAEYAFDVRT